MAIPVWMRVAVSVFALYHLSCALLLPNPGSLVIRHVGRYLIPYANLFGLNTTWQFFSPGPVPVFYFEYSIETAADQASMSESETYYYPARIDRSWSDVQHRRRSSASLFAMNDTWLPNHLVPYFCRQHPEAVALNIRAVLEPTLSLERVRSDATSEDLTERVRTPRQHFECARSADGNNGEDAP